MILFRFYSIFFQDYFFQKSVLSVNYFNPNQIGKDLIKSYFYMKKILSENGLNKRFIFIFIIRFGVDLF